MRPQYNTKACNRCQQSKPLFEFYRRDNGKDGYRNYCKACHHHPAVTPPKPSAPDATEKACKRCHQIKPLSDFHLHPNGRDGRRGVCKACHYTALVGRRALARAKREAEKEVLPSGYKRCRRCREVKPLAGYYLAPDCAGGYRSTCKNCTDKKWVEWKLAHSEHVKQLMGDWHLKTVFGLEAKDYKQMLAEQGAKCAICGNAPNGKRLCVDHDHATGKLRGLLCHSCNAAIGLLGEDPERFARAVAYLLISRFDDSSESP